MNEIVPDLFVALVAVLEELDFVGEHALDQCVAGFFLLFELRSVQLVIVLLVVAMGCRGGVAIGVIAHGIARPAIGVPAILPHLLLFLDLLILLLLLQKVQILISLHIDEIIEITLRFLIRFDQEEAATFFEFKIV